MALNRTKPTLIRAAPRHPLSTRPPRPPYRSPRCACRRCPDEDWRTGVNPGGNVAEENTHNEVSGARAKAPALPLDHSKIQAERRVATERLLARLKAVDVTQEARAPRAYASRYIPEQEPVVLRLLDAGAANGTAPTRPPPNEYTV